MWWRLFDVMQASTHRLFDVLQASTHLSRQWRHQMMKFDIKFQLKLMSSLLVFFCFCFCCLFVSFLSICFFLSIFSVYSWLKFTWNVWLYVRVCVANILACTTCIVIEYNSIVYACTIYRLKRLRNGMCTYRTDLKGTCTVCARTTISMAMVCARTSLFW